MKNFTWLLLTLFFMVATANLFAADYQLGVDTGKTINCINPTERTDGSALAAGDIERIECYIDQTDQNIDSPFMTILMQGGCKPVSVPFDGMDVGTWHQYCRTYDTGGRTDGLSASLPFELLPPIPADPMPPTVTE